MRNGLYFISLSRHKILVVCIYEQGGFVIEDSAGWCPARGRGARPQIVVVSWTRAARCGRVFSRFGCVLRDDRTEAARRRAKSLKAVAAPPTSSEVVGSAKRTDDGALSGDRRAGRLLYPMHEGPFDSAAATRSPRRGHEHRRATPTQRRRRGRVLHRWHSVRRDGRSTSTDRQSDADPLRAVSVVLRRRRLARRAAMAWPRPLQVALGPVAIAKSLPRPLSESHIHCAPSPQPCGGKQSARWCGAAPPRAA